MRRSRYTELHDHQHQEEPQLLPHGEAPGHGAARAGYLLSPSDHQSSGLQVGYNLPPSVTTYKVEGLLFYIKVPPSSKVNCSNFSLEVQRSRLDMI